MRFDFSSPFCFRALLFLIDTPMALFPPCPTNLPHHQSRCPMYCLLCCPNWPYSGTSPLHSLFLARRVQAQNATVRLHPHDSPSFSVLSSMASLNILTSRPGNGSYLFSLFSPPTIVLGTILNLCGLIFSLPDCFLFFFIGLLHVLFFSFGND